MEEDSSPIEDEKEDRWSPLNTPELREEAEWRCEEPEEEEEEHVEEEEEEEEPSGTVGGATFLALGAAFPRTLIPPTKEEKDN